MASTVAVRYDTTQWFLFSMFTIQLFLFSVFYDTTVSFFNVYDTTVPFFCLYDTTVLFSVFCGWFACCRFALDGECVAVALSVKLTSVFVFCVGRLRQEQ